MSIGVLVLCTGNSCRSILAEVLFREMGQGRISAYSAGSDPTGSVNPGAIAKLAVEGLPIEGLASKSWDEFSGPEAPAIDIVIPVCDSAANESCPLWPGEPITVHWGIADPAHAADSGAAFERTFRQLQARIERTLALPIETLRAVVLLRQLQHIHAEALAREE